MQIPVEWGLKFFSSAKVLKIFQIAASATIKESKKRCRRALHVNFSAAYGSPRYFTMKRTACAEKNLAWVDW